MLMQVGRRSEEFSEAQHMMRESVVQRRDMALVEEGRESTTPVDPSSGGGLGGKFESSDNTTHNSRDITICRPIYEGDADEKSDTEIDSAIDIILIYNTRL